MPLPHATVALLRTCSVAAQIPSG